MSIIIHWLILKVSKSKLEDHKDGTGLINIICGFKARGVLLQKTLRGHLTKMGTKINLLVCQYPLFLFNIWFLNKSIFKILQNFSQNCLNSKKIWTRVPKSASWYVNTPYFYSTVGFWISRFSKFSKISAKIVSILRKFEQNQIILVQIWLKIGPIGSCMGHFFFKNRYLYGSTFKFPAAHHLKIHTPCGTFPKFSTGSVWTNSPLREN